MITVGSNVVDVFVRTDPEESDLIRIKHGKLAEEELVAYPLGSKILINHIDFQIGGGGTNTAVATSRIGLKTAYLGKIGRDENGLKVFNKLKAENISFIGTLGETNGYSVILDSVGDDRTILTYKGCNNELKFSEIKKGSLKAKAFYLCTMMGESLKTLIKIAEFAKKQGALVAFNPSSYLAKEGISPIKKLLENTDFLILNDEEAKELGGFGTVSELAERLSKAGAKSVIITMGNKGVTAYHQKTFYTVKASEETTVVETTGAGDAFGSTFFSAIVKGKSIEDALRMGMINAESVIANYGAKNILLSEKIIEKRLEQTRSKRVIKKTSQKKKPAKKKTATKSKRVTKK